MAQLIKPKSGRLIRGVCLLLASLTLLCYWPVTRHKFISFDDPEYVVENSQVQAGLTWRGISWALQTSFDGNWHPVTWISHMLDCQIYGLNAGGHHLTNLLFHIADTLLLFLLLRGLTGAIWRSAFAAALFAWHPLHVESVAWVAERKDVLSTFFFLLTLIGYAAYVRRRIDRCQGATVTEKRSELGELGVISNQCSASSLQHPGLFYVMALVTFALGLMSKAMVVTLPFVLLLMDFWPLQRFQLFTVSPPNKAIAGTPSSLIQRFGTIIRLICEKLPFFALALAASAIAFAAQKAGGAVASLDGIPLGPGRFAIDGGSLHVHSQHWSVYHARLGIM